MLNEGEVNSGSVNQVQRFGDTIHRPSYPWTETINHFLGHLHTKGIKEIGQSLGFHKDGKSVYTYLPGTAALRPWIGILKKEEGLVVLTNFLKRFHQAQADYKIPASAIWYTSNYDPQTGPIIRHGDFGPWNTIWQGQEFSGVIDWDFAEPGTVLQELAQLAWYTVPLSGESGWQEAGFSARPDFKARLQIICQTYGVSLHALLNAVIELQNLEMKRLVELGAKGIFPWSIFYNRGDLSETQQEQAWLKEQIPKWI
ncbi:MAG: aminoglycoside phosphotransferase family protein [Bacteroidota bacterium]